MNQLFPDWYHNTGIDVSDDEIKKRSQGVEAFAKKLKIDQALDLIRLFNGGPVEEFRERFGTSIQKADATFRIRNNDHEMRLLAGAVIAETLNTRGSSTVNDVTAIGVLTANCRGLVSNDTGMQEDILSAATRYLDKEAITVRHADSIDLSEKSDEVTQAIEQFKQIVTQPPLAAVKDAFAAPVELIDKHLLAQASELKKLKYELQIQREESNMAWWVLGEYSRDLNKPFADYNVAAVCVISGKELAAITELMPGPRSAPALLDHVIHSATTELPEAVTLKDAINNTPRDWRQGWISSIRLEPLVDLCPVHLAVQLSLGGDAWVRAFNSRGTIKATQSFTPLDLALETYQESLLVGIVSRN